MKTKQDKISGEINLHIRAIRVFLGLSQSVWADKLKVSESLVSMIESGKREPSHDYMTKVAKFLGCPVERIVFGPSSLILRQIMREYGELDYKN